MTQIIDRRLNGKNKSTVNRQRFIKRFKKQIKEAVSKAISRRSITNISNGETISIPSKDINEPQLVHGKGGNREIILPGNKEFIRGDKIQKPPSDADGTGSKASNQGEGLDNFAFELSKEEFMDLFFEDLELPDLVKTKLKETPSYKYVRSGYVTHGIPSNINLLRSFRNSLARRIAFSGKYKKQLKQAEIELSTLKAIESDDAKISELQREIEFLQKKISNIPFIDEFDIRYNNRIKVSQPCTSAVMFCIMDVSGSMDEAKKEIAKRFFILLYLFLTKQYPKIDLVFIRHHTTAKEVNEEEFFYSRETGGTVVSSALECTSEIMQQRYPTDEWNIYVAQASDGDNWNADSPLCKTMLMKQIMPFVQYYAYVEILPRHHQSLWQAYNEVNEIYNNFSIRGINDIQEIYPIFHELFKRKDL